MEKIEEFLRFQRKRSTRNMYRSTILSFFNCIFSRKSGRITEQEFEEYEKFVPNPIKPRNYPEEFKEMVVRAVVKEGVGVRQTSRIFKISQNTVISWKREISKKGCE